MNYSESAMSIIWIGKVECQSMQIGICRNFQNFIWTKMYWFYSHCLQVTKHCPCNRIVVKLVIYICCFNVYGSKLWNKLPLDIQDSDSVHMSKMSLHNYLSNTLYFLLYFVVIIFYLFHICHSECLKFNKCFFSFIHMFD